MFRFRSSLIALLVAALAAGFLGGRLTSTGQGTEIDTLKQTVVQLSQTVGELKTGMVAPEEIQDLSGRVAGLEEGLHKEQTTTTGQGTEIETLKGAITQLSQKLGELETAAATPEELQGLAGRVAALEEGLQRWEGRFEELTAKVEAVAEQKLKMGYVDMAKVNQKRQELELEGAEYEATLQEIIQRIGEEEDYDLIIQGNDVILYPQAESITDLTDQVIAALQEG